LRRAKPRSRGLRRWSIPFYGELPDVPGALSRLAGVVGKHAGNIVDERLVELWPRMGAARELLPGIVPELRSD
jgi:hypothetical protein